jgi:hypothetical protein
MKLRKGMQRHGCGGGGFELGSVNCGGTIELSHSDELTTLARGKYCTEKVKLLEIKQYAEEY